MKKKDESGKSKSEENAVNIPNNGPATFEDAQEIITQRLNSLREDLSFKSPIEYSIFNELTKVHDDKKISLMDFYAHFYSPCRVSEPSFVAKGQGDMNDVMLDFSQGFDKFIKTLEEEYEKMILVRRDATILLCRMLSLPYPYSTMLYMYYYRKLDPAVICKTYYLSRATFFRIKFTAVAKVTREYYPELYKQYRIKCHEDFQNMLKNAKERRMQEDSEDKKQKTASKKTKTASSKSKTVSSKSKTSGSKSKSVKSKPKKNKSDKHGPDDPQMKC